jgi:hypothetical protein
VSVQPGACSRWWSWRQTGTWLHQQILLLTWGSIPGIDLEDPNTVARAASTSNQEMQIQILLELQPWLVARPISLDQTDAGSPLARWKLRDVGTVGGSAHADRMSDTMTQPEWSFSVSVPAGPVQMTGTVRAPTAEKAAEYALEAAIPLMPGLVKATVTVEREGISAGLSVEVGLARFCVEIGPNGLEQELEFTLDSRGAEIQMEAEQSERQRQPQPGKDAQLQRQAKKLERETAHQRELERLLRDAELERQWQWHREEREAGD